MLMVSAPSFLQLLVSLLLTVHDVRGPDVASHDAKSELAGVAYICT